MSMDQGIVSPGQRGYNHINKEGLNLITSSSRSSGVAITTKSSRNVSAEITQSTKGSWTLQGTSLGEYHSRRTVTSAERISSTQNYPVHQRRSSRRKTPTHYDTPPDSSPSSPGSPISTTKHCLERDSGITPSPLTPPSSKQSFQWEHSSRPGSLSSTGQIQQQRHRRKSSQTPLDENSKINGSMQSRGTRTTSKQKDPSVRSTSTSDESSRVPVRRPSRRRTNTATSTMPKDAVHNVHEALALHERSKKIFEEKAQEISSVEISPTPSSVDLPFTIEGDFKSLSRTRSTTQAPPVPSIPVNGLPHMSRPGPPIRMVTEPNMSRKRPATSHQNTQLQNPSFSDEHLHSRPSMLLTTLSTEATTQYWTSDETRRREYAAIDKRNKGIRGIWNRIKPKLGRKSTQSKFYEEDDASDTGSVRRYRLRMDE